MSIHRNTYTKYNDEKGGAHQTRLFKSATRTRTNKIISRPTLQLFKNANIVCTTDFDGRAFH